MIATLDAQIAAICSDTPQFWLNLQTRYDLEVAEGRVSDQVAAITPLQVA